LWTCQTEHVFRCFFIFIWFYICHCCLELSNTKLIKCETKHRKFLSIITINVFTALLSRSRNILPSTISKTRPNQTNSLLNFKSSNLHTIRANIHRKEKEIQQLFFHHELSKEINICIYSCKLCNLCKKWQNVRTFWTT
jgi:hypothetical protein